MNSHKLFLMKMQDARPSTYYNLNCCDKSQSHAGDVDETSFNGKKMRKYTSHAHTKGIGQILDKNHVPNCYNQSNYFPSNTNEQNKTCEHMHITMKKERNKHTHMKQLPCSLVLHEVWTLLKKFSCLPKNRPPHCALRQTFPPIPHFIPLQESSAKTEHQGNNNKNHYEQSHWCSQKRDFKTVVTPCFSC